ncbi:MAG: glycosyltransferase family 2 protein [Opitutaceae bacterium]|nr:glycosyltransferase family 2 protein [Opitutaceae bacterium]
MPTPRVTVIICTYNRADLLRQTLAGVAQQDYPAGELEVLVIDNNSRDATPAVVAEFAGTPHPPRHVRETAQGLDHARNRGLAEARGDILLFADDDILVEPDWVRQMAAPFAGDDVHRIGCVGGEVVPVFPDGLPDWIREWHAPLAFRQDAGPVPPPHSPMGANFAFPRRVFEKVGPFAAGLDRKGAALFGGGDAEMVRRVRAAGYEVWFAPAAKVLHQMPASRTTFRYAARHAFDSARSRVADRAGRPGAAGYLLSRFFVNLLKTLGFTVLALLSLIAVRPDAAKKSLVRAWRSCGYLWQIPRALCGKV